MIYKLIQIHFEKRAAEKEANRLRLAAEFPVLFNNTVKKSSQKSTTPTLNAKRKSVFNEQLTENDDVNDENNSKQHNISRLVNTNLNEKQQAKNLITKIPLSNKKIKKINNDSIKESDSSMKDKNENITKHDAKFNKLSQLIMKCPPQSPMPSSMGGTTGLELTSFSLVQESKTTDEFLLEASIEEVSMSHEPIFQSPIPQQPQVVVDNTTATTTTTNENNNNNTTNESSSVARISIVPDENNNNNNNIIIQEQVNEVMDFLLECNEIDVVTHRRVSSLSFSAQTLKRLSISNTQTRQSLVPVEGDNDNNNNVLIVSDDVSTIANEDVAVGVVNLESEDVLVALRNFINNLDHNVIDVSVQDNVDVVVDNNSDNKNMVSTENVFNEHQLKESTEGIVNTVITDK